MKSMVENRGRWAAGFRSPLLRFFKIFLKGPIMHGLQRCIKSILLVQSGSGTASILCILCSLDIIQSHLIIY